MRTVSRNCIALSVLFPLVLVLAGCSLAASSALVSASPASAQQSSAQLEFSHAPELIANPSGRVPLAAEIRFSTSPGQTVTVEISDLERSWTAEGDFEVDTGSGEYSVPLVGMKAGRDHILKLAISDANGDVVHRQDFAHSTPSLPSSQLLFPPITIETSDPRRMEPGLTFLSVRRRYPGRGHWLTPKQMQFSVQWGMIVVLDAHGDVVWYYESDSRVSGIDQLSNGNIVMHRANFSTLEVDLLGNTVRQFYAEDRPFPPPKDPNAIPIRGQQTLHHQPHEMPDGTFLAFSANGFLIPDYPTSELDPDAPKRDQMVMADSVVIFDQSGKQVWSWNTLDHLDPYRIGYDTFWSYWWTRGFPDHVDWTHGNGLSYDEKTDSILVSLRHQLAVLSIDRSSKELNWILGRHDNWPEHLQDKLLTPIGEDFMWFGYQHNPRYTPEGNVIMFDNRANGARMPFEPRPEYTSNFSRAVEYRIDPEAMTVEQVWTTGDEPGQDPCYSMAMGDAWRLPETGNHLVIHSFCLALEEGLTDDIMDSTKRAGVDLPHAGGPVIEFSGYDIVFKAMIADPDDLLQWQIYGGFRAPDFYSTKPHKGH